MGDIADMMIDGTLDEQTGEYIGKPCGYPRTLQHGFYNSVQPKSSDKVKTIRKELALLIESKQALCITEKEKNAALNTARQEINLKYGKDWRNLL